jgi:hypothetical protein
MHVFVSTTIFLSLWKNSATVGEWYFRTGSPRNLSSYHSEGEDVAEHFECICSLGLLASVTGGS